MSDSAFILNQLSLENPRLAPRYVNNLVSLIDEGATVPFIARYRKERTGNMDEEQIRNILDRYTYFKELEDRKLTVLKRIENLGKLSPDLQTKVVTCLDKQELEDLYLPYRPKRKTKASVAKDKGLEPLALKIFQQEQLFEPLVEAAAYLNPALEVATAEDALEGAGHIIAEWISESAEARGYLRTFVMRHGTLCSTVLKDKAEERSKFEDYYAFQEPLSSIPAHRYLAIRRGNKLGYLKIGIEFPEDQALVFLEELFLKTPSPELGAFLQKCIKDSLKRLLFPAIELELRTQLREKADLSAIEVFASNLRELLMAPPAGDKRVIGIDPGIRTGCKVVYINETGKYLETITIYPFSGATKAAEAKPALMDMIKRYDPEFVVIGNGTASRETEKVVKDLFNEQACRVPVLIVSESGASVYSASDVAREEFPELDVTVRGAISIARRFQDPLAELVKIEPQSIGVGQYQHDVNPNRLQTMLNSVVESCVNTVGVDLKTASSSLLSYVSGIGPALAKAIVKHREDHGHFNSRLELLQVSGMGEKTFEQAAGFLRIRDGENLLDNTGIHPESYGIVERMARKLAVPIKTMLGNKSLLDRIDLEAFISENVGLLTLKDIYADLLKPGRDPRKSLRVPRFREDVTSIADLSPGMILEGIITNVTNFGVFVDIGIHADGLIHVSELSNKFVKDPSEVVSLGEVLQVKVLEIDQERNRISLSRKQALVARKPGVKKSEPQPTASPSVGELIKLRDHFKGRG